MDALLRRPQGGAGDASRQIPAAAGAGCRRHRRGTGVEDPAAQLQRVDPCSRRASARRDVPALSRLSDGRHDRRVALQRRPAGRGGEGARQDLEDRQTDAGHYRNSLYDDHRVDQGVDHQGQREGQDQDPPRGRQHGRARGDHRAGGARRVVGQDDRRALRLHRLRGVDFAQRLRHPGREAPLHGSERDPAPFGRSYAGAAGAGARNPVA